MKILASLSSGKSVSDRMVSGRGYTVWMRVLFTVLALAVPVVASAEEASQGPLEDRLMIRGGWAYAFGAHTIVTVPGPGGVAGTALDFNKTLGGDTSTNAFRLEGQWRFNERHSMQVAWYRVAFSGQKALDQTINVGDNTIGVGAGVNSSLSFNMYRAMYQYSFYQNDKVELAFIPGLYLAQTKFSLDANGTITQGGNQVASGTSHTSENLTLPLPSLGFLTNYHITPKFLTQIRGDWFYLKSGKFEGSMMEFYAGMEYRLIKNIGVGAAYDRLIVNAESSASDGFRADASWNLAYFYASLYFF